MSFLFKKKRTRSSVIVNLIVSGITWIGVSNIALGLID